MLLVRVTRQESSQRKMLRCLTALPGSEKTPAQSAQAARA